MLPDLTNCLIAAKDLLGWKLVHESPEGKTSGYIVETEAYDMSEPASHAFGGMRTRNAPMYQEAGTIYVYFIYGMHYCMNIVTGPKGQGQAVLIRAIEPVEGLELMQNRRGAAGRNLTNGPGKLVQAMGIEKSANGTPLKPGHIYLESGIQPQGIMQTARVGISKAVEHPWRFYITGNAYVSKR